MKLFKYEDFLNEEVRNKDDKLYLYSGRIFRIIGLNDILDDESLAKLEELKSTYQFDDWARATFVCKESPIGKSKDLDKQVRLSLKLNQATFYKTTKGKEGELIDDDDFIFTDQNDNSVYLYIFNKNKNEDVRGGITRQLHGFNYEKEIKALNDLSTKDAYTSRWDAKGSISSNYIESRIEDGYSIIQNKDGKKIVIDDFDEIDPEFKDEYLWNIKNIKSGSSIDLGDLLRISGLKKTATGISKIEYTTPMTHFIFCIGFWRDNKDNIVNEYIIHIDKSIWEQLLPDFIRAYLRNTRNNDIITMYSELPNFRTRVKKKDTAWDEFMSTYLELSGDSAIRPRFKRDSKGQLRIQAGISNSDFIQKVLAVSDYIYLSK